MPKPLVIVESPAKAKTISKFLGNAFDVRASVGHVADLPSKGLQIDVDNGFKPTYELTLRGKDVVKDLRAAMKNADELYLATDEDREGEAISWHLLEYLKPKIPVKRMVFHEITKAAIDHAVANPRGIDYGLVDAAETRRLLDRLYGYEVSPVLWRRVNRGLSAGRVQSPSVRLIVERERERIAFVTAPYWDIDLLTATGPAFTATLVALDGTKVATGKDFRSDGVAKPNVVVVDEARARALAGALDGADVTVRSVEEKPYRSSPKPPFMTSTLQQEGGRKLRLGAAQVMRIAQGLYERGYITYMRTDAVNLSDEAKNAVRAEIHRAYGQQFVSPTPRSYSTKVKNAQEAHEAIRPTTPLRSPDSLAGELNGQELSLYRLIWQRTLASQMADAAGTTVSVRLAAAVREPAGTGAPGGTDCEFAASGTTITFPGYRQVYVESTDDAGDGDAEREALLPPLAVGQAVPIAEITPNGHATTPPARYTEASLVKRLEELGIGRPSTWASIIQTVQDRGYVWKKGQALVPTWTAFAVIGLMERHFGELVDYAFTAKIEEDLDAIARAERQKQDWLHDFYFGDEDDALPGLKRLVEENLDAIDAAEINTFPIGADPNGETVVVKPGKYGPYVKRGEDTASVPDDLAPDELTVELALLSMLIALPFMAEKLHAEMIQYVAFLRDHAKDLYQTGKDLRTGAGSPILPNYADQTPGEPGDDPFDPGDPSDPEPITREDRTVIFDFEGKYPMWYRTIDGPKMLLLHVEKIRLSIETDKMTPDAYDEWNELVRRYFTNRAIILPVKNDYWDATYWSGRFLEIILGKSAVVSVIEIYGRDEAGRPAYRNDFKPISKSKLKRLPAATFMLPAGAKIR